MKNQVRTGKGARDRSRAVLLAAVLLLATYVLSGCGLTAQSAGPDPAATPAPTPAPTPDPEQLAREKRLEEARDGFVWEDGYLYTIDGSGELRTDCYVGVLYFGEDGRYTSGSRELDDLVASVIAGNTDADMTRFEMLRAMYEYTRDHISYVGFGNHDLSYQYAHGPDGWMTDLAIRALDEGVGNCYYYAAAFTALARGVGYQAYATGGLIGAIDDPHGWAEIVDEEGNIWFCDPEMEYRLADWQERGGDVKEIPDLFWKTQEEAGNALAMGYSAIKDPFKPEADAAAERAKGASNHSQQE